MNYKVHFIPLNSTISICQQLSGRPLSISMKKSLYELCSILLSGAFFRNRAFAIRAKSPPVRVSRLYL